MKKRADDIEFVINAREPALGAGILVTRHGDGTRTYRFARGGERRFKDTYCELYMKPTVVNDLVRDQLVPPPPKPLPVVALASQPEMEAQIAERPDDAEPYLVYADWLQAKQDPRGLLIVAQHQRASAPRDKALAAAEQKLLDAHGAYFMPVLLGAALKLPKRGKALRCAVEWSSGYFKSVRLARDSTPSAQDIDLDDVAGELLAHPSAQFIRSLVVGPLGTPAYSYLSIVHAIGKRHHALLGELVIGDFGPADMELALTRAGDIAPLFRAPKLTRLVVRAGELRVGKRVTHAALRELRVISSVSDAKPLDALVASSLPALETLELVTNGVAFEPAQLERWRAGGPAPNLRHLAIRGTRGTRALLEALLESPLLARLHTLELDGGDLDDPGLAKLLANQDKVAHLSKLDVGGPRVSADMAGKLSARLRGATAERPRFVLTEADVVASAPDRASMAAARKLARADAWLELGIDTRRNRVWGEYEGRDHYYVFTAVRGREAGCDCGSPKDPCKHALALRLLVARQHAFADRPIPDAAVRNASQERPSYRSDGDYEW